MTRSRNLLLLATFALLALASSGCVGFTSTTANQATSLGSVQLAVQACADTSPGCTASGNMAGFWKFLHDGANTSTFPSQVTFGVRLLEGATPPATLQATVPGTQTKLTFTRSASFESELQRLEPAPAGQRWWGWLSDEVAYGKDTKQALSLSFEVPLPHPADGSALPSPMPWRPVIGSRFVMPAQGLPASRPVVCGEALGEGVGENPSSPTPTTICVDSPTPEAIGGRLNAAIIDFGLTGTDTTAPAGSTVSVPFLARRTGVTDPATTFTLSVAGGPPGATVKLDRTSVSLGGDSVQPLLVELAIPEGTPAGAYPVTITGVAAGKPDRKGTATVIVPAKPVTPVDPPTPPVEAPPADDPKAGDTAAPGLTASLAHKRFRRSTTLRATLTEPASLKVVVLRGKRPVVTLKRKLPKGRSRVAIAKRIGARRLKPGAHTLVLVATDAAGNRSAKRRLAFRVTA